MNKVVVITGASKGIGAVAAMAFARAGYDVAINYRSDNQAAAELVANITQLGRQALAVQSDIFTEAGIQELFSQVRQKFTKIDVLVNNAASPSDPNFGEYTYENVGASLAANFGSAALCTQEAVKLMDKGSVLFVSSIYGLQFGGSPGMPLYSAGKAAMINFAQTMAEKLAPNIRCNTVVPGTTRTPHWDHVAEVYSRKSLSMTLQNEWVDAEEIADALVFLATVPHITAQSITIDAGWQKKIRGPLEQV
jgi:3-oxoacyl-[acyl-carrier protein] reductase